MKIGCLAALFIVSSIAALSASGTGTDWTYDYHDDFSTHRAEHDSYDHSVFWPEEAFPPAEPYLYYASTQGSPPPALMFMAFSGRPAHLTYCFPIAPTGNVLREVSGTMEFDLQFRVTADAVTNIRPHGYMSYSLSPDGYVWTIPIPMRPGHQSIPISSLQGTCYVALSGHDAWIDNLQVYLTSPPATIRVPDDYPTIQEGIDHASDGDIVEVAPGVYSGPGNRDIELRGKAITVRSSNGPDVTIIDCEATSSNSANHRAFYIHEAERSDTIIHGFTITSGRIQGSEIPPDDMRWNMDPCHPIGAGIYCELSSPTIVNCVVLDCGTEVGGGIGCVGGEPLIRRCKIVACRAGGFGPCESGGRGAGIGLIRQCSARIIRCEIMYNTGYYNSHGGGLYCRRSVAKVIGCDISFNDADGNIDGGGVYCAGPLSDVLLRNCIVSNNVAQAGGGIFAERGEDMTDCTEAQCAPCQISVRNCTIAHNRLNYPMPPYPGGGVHSIGTNIIIKNSIVWYNEGTQLVLIDPACNSPVIFSDVQNGYPGAGNIDDNPLFAPRDVPDYHLQSRFGRYDPGLGQWVRDRLTSPCIDAGDPRDPVGREPVPNGHRINMGVYGGTRQASMSRRNSNVADLNGDGTVNLKDIAVIQKQWLRSEEWVEDPE